MSIMHIDCVFSGGGLKAYAFIGALDKVEERNLKIKRVAGTSAGAIIAALLAAKYTIDEIKRILFELQIEDLLDPPVLNKYMSFIKWISLYRKMGMYKGNKFEDWIKSVLSKKGLHTFQDLEENALKIVISDISLGKLVIIPDDLQRIYGIEPKNFNIATAVRMSASYPYFFMPKKLYYKNTYSYIVDGGVLSNFPLWIFRQNNRDKRPVLGMSLSETIDNVSSIKITQSLDMFRALFITMMRAHDTRYIAKAKQEQIVFLPVKQFKTLHSSMKLTEKQQLYNIGYDEMSRFLKTWPK